jgi:hypothetical protein
VQIDLINFKAFFTHCQNVTKAAENLPLIISTQSFQDANNYARAEIKKLHESLYKFEEGEYQCSDGEKRYYCTCTPLALDIANFLNDDAIENDDVKQATDKIIKSFLGLMAALNKFIRLKNELPPKDFTIEKNVLEESFTELTSVLGTVIKPLGDHIKDVLEDCIYNGPVLGSLKRQMDKKFGNEPKTIRELLTLDKTQMVQYEKNLLTRRSLKKKLKQKNINVRKLKDHKRNKLERLIEKNNYL